MTACIVCRLPLAEAMLGLGTTDSPPPSASTLALLWVSSRDKLQGPLEGASREADGADIEGFLCLLLDRPQFLLGFSLPPSIFMSISRSMREKHSST
mmetsp:Transcript_12809/g.29045  ORF Transcript_12809/g.29045 Transcript_12809/m.29045 type:complete len:97 (+) Transcript_12809:198-488(+)